MLCVILDHMDKPVHCYNVVEIQVLTFISYSIYSSIYSHLIPEIRREKTGVTKQMAGELMR
jgi:hypothetical protein